MKVREWAKENPETWVKLGAHQGSCFIFIGKGKDFEAFEKKYNKAEYRRLKAVLKDLDNQLTGWGKKSEERVLKKCKEYISNYLNAQKKAEFERFENIDDLLSKTRTYEKDLFHRLNKQRELTMMRLYFFTDIGERELMKFNKASVENKYGVAEEIILFHGYEAGDYWTIDEFEADQ